MGRSRRNDLRRRLSLGQAVCDGAFECKKSRQGVYSCVHSIMAGHGPLLTSRGSSDKKDKAVLQPAHPILTTSVPYW